MTQEIAPGVTWHTTPYSLKLPSEDTPKIEGRIDFWMREDIREHDRPIVVVHGLGETEDNIKTLVQESADLPLIGVKLEFPDTSPEGMEATLGSSLLAVARRAGKILRKEVAMDIVGYSIGSCALKAVQAAPDEWNNVAVVGPYGFVSLTPREIRKRLAANSKAESEDPADNVRLFEESLITRETALMVKAMMEYGASQNGPAIVEELSGQGKEVVIIALEDDIVFPPSDIKASLEGVGLADIVEIAKGRHLHFGAPTGREQLRFGIRSLLAKSSVLLNQATA